MTVAIPPGKPNAALEEIAVVTTVAVMVVKCFAPTPTLLFNNMAQKNIYTPKNIAELHMARDAMNALFTADSDALFGLTDIGLVPLLAVDFRSLCYGCTDKDAQNYDPKAEVDDNTCL